MKRLVFLLIFFLLNKISVDTYFGNYVCTFLQHIRMCLLNKNTEHALRVIKSEIKESFLYGN
jgi:hypothetical protein